MAAIIVAILACIPLFLNIEKGDIEDNSISTTTFTMITTAQTTEKTTSGEGSGGSGEGPGFVESTESEIFPTTTTTTTTQSIGFPLLKFFF